MIELYGEIRCDSIFSYSLTLVFKDEVKGKVVAKVFTLGCRGYTLINQGGICGSFREPRGA
jgi:hypothetical protein